MVGFVGHTKSFALSASTPVLIAPYSLYRKGVMVSNPDATPIYIAIGMNPSDSDFFQLGVNKSLILDHLVPILPIWAKGVGRAVVLDNEVGLEPYDVQDLFKTTEGIWLDFSDMSTMWQDADGLNPVRASGQPVGLILGKEKGFGPNTITPASITVNEGATKVGTSMTIDVPAATAAQAFGRVEGAIVPLPGWAVLDVTLENTVGSYNLVAANFRTVPLNPGRNRYVLKGEGAATGNFAISAGGGAGAYKAKITFHSCVRVQGKSLQAKVPTERGVFIKDKQLGYLQLDGTAEYVIPNSKNMFDYLVSRDGRSMVITTFRSETKANDFRLAGLLGSNGMRVGNKGYSLGIDRRETQPAVHGIVMGGNITPDASSMYFQVYTDISTTRNYIVSQVLEPTGEQSMANRVSLGNISIINQFGYPRTGETMYDMSVAGAGPMIGHTKPFESKFLGRMYNLLIAKNVPVDTAELVKRALAADAEIPF